MVTGFVFPPCWSRVPSCQSRANLTIGVLYLIQVVNSLLFIVLPVASEKWVPSISGVLAELLELIMQNASDADILCSRNGRADGLREMISHDEWYQLLG